jgi:hypothetical protein
MAEPLGNDKSGEIDVDYDADADDEATKGEPTTKEAPDELTTSKQTDEGQPKEKQARTSNLTEEGLPKKKQQRTSKQMEENQPKQKQPAVPGSSTQPSAEQPAVAGSRRQGLAEQPGATPAEQPAVVGSLRSVALEHPTVVGSRRRIAPAEPPAVQSDDRVWRGDVSIMALLCKENTRLTMDLPWNAVGLVMAGLTDTDVLVKDGFVRSISPPPTPLPSRVATLDVWRPQVVYHSSAVAEVSWNKRVAWVSRGEYDEFEDIADGSEAINQYSIARVKFHSRIQSITGGTLVLGLAIFSEPWDKEAARSAMEFFIDQRTHVIVAACLRSKMSRGRGKLSLQELQRAFANDGRFRLTDATGLLEFDGVRVLRPVPMPGIEWPLMVEFTPKVKQWRPNVASIWVHGPVASVRSDEALQRRRSKHNNPRSREVASSSGPARESQATRGRGLPLVPAADSEQSSRRSPRAARGSGSRQ